MSAGGVQDDGHGAGRSADMEADAGLRMQGDVERTSCEMGGNVRRQ
jgi:hypothetical protein